MAEESGIYAEDIVKNSQGIVGLVLEDAEETTDESDSEEEALKKGQIVVCWYPSGNEETLSLSKVSRKDFLANRLACFDLVTFRVTCEFFTTRFTPFFVDCDPCGVFSYLIRH